MYVGGVHISQQSKAYVFFKYFVIKHFLRNISTIFGWWFGGLVVIKEILISCFNDWTVEGFLTVFVLKTSFFALTVPSACCKPDFHLKYYYARI